MQIRFKDIMARFEDPTYRVLANNYYDSIIPEIYAEFGPEVTKRFVKIFSGKQVNVPNYRDLCDDMLSGTVMSLSGGNRDELYRISEEYGLQYGTLARIFDRAEKNSKLDKGEEK